MLNVRPLSESDTAAALRLSTQAGWNQIESDWRRLLTLWPTTCLGGWIDDTLVATGTLATFGAGLGWVGMILVDEAERGRGHGGAIFDAILRLASDFGIRRLGLDATDLGRPVYLKRGFTDVAGIDRWSFTSTRRETHAIRNVIAANSPTASPSPDHWPSIAELDFAATGVDRTVLLQRLATEPGAAMRVGVDHNRVNGFACFRVGRVADMIGPIVARSPETATLLLHDLLKQRQPEREVFIDAPRDNGFGEALTSSGFRIARRLTRMLRPEGRGPTLTHPTIFAAAGFELG